MVGNVSRQIDLLGAVEKSSPKCLSRKGSLSFGPKAVRVPKCCGVTPSKPGCHAFHFYKKIPGLSSSCHWLNHTAVISLYSSHCTKSPTYYEHETQRKKQHTKRSNAVGCRRNAMIYVHGQPLHLFSTSRKCIATYAMTMNTPEIMPSPITSDHRASVSKPKALKIEAPGTSMSRPYLWSISVR